MEGENLVKPTAFRVIIEYSKRITLFLHIIVKPTILLSEYWIYFLTLDTNEGVSEGRLQAHWKFNKYTTCGHNFMHN